MADVDAGVLEKLRHLQQQQQQWRWLAAATKTLNSADDLTKKFFSGQDDSAAIGFIDSLIAQQGL